MQKHSWQPDFNDKSKCAICKKPYLDAHSPLSSCEACGKVSEVILFGPADNPKGMLLCADCSQHEIDTAVSIAQNTPIEIQEQRIQEMNARINAAREIDTSILYSGDYFNAPTIPSEDIRHTIYESGLDEAGKKQVFNEFLSSRMLHLREHIFLTLEAVKDDDSFTKREVYASLRDMASALYREIRERIAAEDKNYVSPIQRQVKPKVKKETLGTYDRLVQMFMTMHSCSKEEAIEAINKGSGGKLGNSKLTVNS